MNSPWFELEPSLREESAGRFRHVSISRWGLSERTFNALTRHDPNMTVGDVIGADASISSIRGIGAGCVSELHARVMELLDGSRGEDSFALEAEPGAAAALTAADFPTEVLQLSLDLLHLERRTYSALERAGASTVGDLLALAGSAFEGVPKPYRKNAREAEAALAALAASADGEGEVDWVSFCRLRGVRLLPEECDPRAGTASLIEGLPPVVRQVLNASLGERGWLIAQRRFGLEGAKELTLEELGAAFNLTRERIRQLETKAISALGDAFIEGRYRAKDFRVHPAVARAVRDLYDFLSKATARPVIETELIEDVRMTFGIDAEAAEPALVLVGALAGVERLSLRAPGLTRVWGAIDAAERGRLESVIWHLDDLLTRETALPVPPFDVLVRLNQRLRKQERLTLEELPYFERLCSSVERTEEGLLRGRFELLKGRGNQVERLLTEAGRPLSLAEMAREINARLVPSGGREVQVANLSNQLSADTSGRFVPVGRSGQWGLREWPHVETASILDLMEQCLVTLNRAAAPEEIYAYVRERRPVSENSIAMYLAGNRDTFVKLDRTRWGLTAWAEAPGAQTWNPRQVAEFVAGLFRERRVRELEYGVIRDELMAAAGVNARQARGMLRRNPVFKTRVGERWDERFAVFQPDYEQRLNNASEMFVRRQPTLRERMAEGARRMLESAPGRQLPLAELAVRLAREFDTHKPTVYSYVSGYDFLETQELPGARQKVCRLKESTEAMFPRVRDIATAELRQKIERTLPFLTEDHVDIGLFLLSKEFEATLKGYLKAAHARCALRVVPSKPMDDLRLNDMVILAKDNGVITDLSVLNYLRQERNSRAHGTMPNLVERQAQMVNVRNLAGLYIDYIKILDDAHNDLVATAVQPAVV